MKKQRRLFFTLFLTFCMCVGCGNQKDAESTQQAAAKETVQETAIHTETSDSETSAQTAPETEADAENENTEGYEEVILDNAELMDD